MMGSSPAVRGSPNTLSVSYADAIGLSHIIVFYVREDVIGAKTEDRSMNTLNER
jgi:hypothetical protein